MAPKLGLQDTLRFHLGVTTPALLWGLIAPNRWFVPLLSWLNAGRCVAGTLNALREKHGDRFWVTFPFGLAGLTLVALDPDSMQQLLDSDQNQADPKLKKNALSKFIPDALTVSAETEWKNRRDFNEHVLDTRSHVHRYGEAFKAIAYAEVGRVARSSTFELRWPDFRTLALRMSQQVLLGSGVLEPVLALQVAQMIFRGNWLLPRNQSAFSDFYEHLGKHLQRQRAALAAPNPCLMHDSAERLVRGIATDVTCVPRQIAFWVFVLKDALELHVSRTLALIAAHPEVQERVREEVREAQPMTAQKVNELHLLDACVREQLRLWTPVPMLWRRAFQGFDVNGVRIEPGQEVLLFTGRYHRDPQVFGEVADRFAPDAAKDGLPQEVYFFSQGRQACAGQHLAKFMIKATLAALLARCRADLIGPRVDPARIPYLYNHFKIKLRMTPDT